ncbi:hypothetical protein AVEN_50690-1 [Araneus ventricosus]|uniref:Uncharacterized protein n=1 Tax=Araneus ventricosus TaxID=182803 RepID=A0A4Y2M1I2_ARAVE|nr:hypothetical protein AVEN_50690-1 [Araneus ventricosus]
MLHDVELMAILRNPTGSCCWLGGGHTIRGCEKALRGLLDWCSNSPPQEQNEASAKLNLWRYDGKGPCPVKTKTSLRVQLIGSKLNLGMML